MRTLQHFTQNVDFNCTALDKSLPNYKFDTLTHLENVSIKNKIPISEQLITHLYQSNLSIHEYVASNQLFHEFRTQFDIGPFTTNTNKKYDALLNYIHEYPRLIGHKFPTQNPFTDTLTPFNDTPELILPYFIAINETVRRLRSELPLQIDTYLVARNNLKISQLHLHSLTLDKDQTIQICVKSDTHSRGDTVDTIADTKALLYDTLLNSKRFERYTVLIIRGSPNDLSKDTIYILKSKDRLPSTVITDYSELPFLAHSAQNIIPGLSSKDDGIIGMNYHLHSQYSNKIYLSFGRYKQRIFKRDILPKLALVCDDNSAFNVSEFARDYRDMTDDSYGMCKQWFEVAPINENTVTEPTEAPPRKSSMITQENESLIKFVAFEPTEMPKNKASETVTNVPTCIDMSQQANVDCNCESEPFSWYESSDESDAEIGELETMMSEMNRELLELENEVLNMELDSACMDEMMEEIESMEERANEMYESVCLSDDSD